MTRIDPRKIFASLLGLFALLSLALPHSAWAALAGHFQFVAGDVRVVGPDGKERPARKGEGVNEKETIVSGKDGSAQLRMIDEGIVAVRPETSLRIDEYKFADRENGAERGFFSLLKGGFRSITGAIGRVNKDNYGIRTPAATIGIRGTDHETVHLATALPNLPEGTYNKVNTGATVVNGTPVGINQVAYAPNPHTPAAILPHTPPIFEVTRSVQPGKDGKKTDAGPPPANTQPAPAPTDGGTQPAPAPVSGTAQPAPATAPAPLPPPTDLIGSALLPPPPPPSTTLITSTTGSGAVTSGSGTILAPVGTGGVGGDISIRSEWNGSSNVTGPFAGSGGMVVEGPSQTILFDTTTRLPVLVAEQSANSNMQYSAGTAQMIDVGQTMIGTAKVTWGRYVGPDQFVDSQGTRDPITMSLMFTDQAMTFLQASTYFQSNSHTFAMVPGAGNIVDELGATYAVTGSLAVTSTASPVVSLGINASNATRAWGLNYSGTLQQFYQNNCANGPCGLPLTSATLTGAGTVSTFKGEASGVFIAPNAAGALTSYSANAFNPSGALAGSLLGTSLFKR